MQPIPLSVLNFSKWPISLHMSEEVNKSCTDPKCHGLAKCSVYQHEIYRIQTKNNVIDPSFTVTARVPLQQSNFFDKYFLPQSSLLNIQNSPKKIEVFWIKPLSYQLANDRNDLRECLRHWIPPYRDRQIHKPQAL